MFRCFQKAVDFKENIYQTVTQTRLHKFLDYQEQVDTKLWSTLSLEKHLKSYFGDTYI